MAAIEVTITGVLYDKLQRTVQNVVLIGEASLTGVGVGGGPIVPPPGAPGVWPPAHPAHPIVLPGDPSWGPPGGQPPDPNAPRPSHPIALPGDPWWPSDPPPQIPAPGSPPVILPGGAPTHPITPPPAIVVDYPGVGKVLVPQPLPPA